jgi:hypothetical protein
MRYKVFLLGLCLPFFTLAQSNKQVLSKDSIRYYQNELHNIWKSTYDSVRNSERYKELNSKLSQHQKVVRVELLANFGLYINDFKNLNARLQSIGQKGSSKAAPSLGLTLAIGFPVMIYGFDLSGYTLGNKTTDFKGMHGRFFIGTHIFKKSPIILNPQIGYAFSYLNMYLRRSPTSPNFNDLFTTQSNAVGLIHQNNYLDFTLGFKLKSPGKENFYWQFLRVGYRYGLKEAAWEGQDTKINDAPKDRNNQMFIQICIGFDRQ